MIDDGTQLLRVQVKTGHQNGTGAVCWSPRSTRFYDGKSRSYHGEADLFAVWVPEMRQCYLVPVNECGRYKAILRLTPARNGQSFGVRLAADYVLRPVLRSATVRRSSVAECGGL